MQRFFFNFRSNLGYIVNIEKDPEMSKLAAEARRLSLGITNGHSNGHNADNNINNRSSRGPSETRTESTPNSRKSSNSDSGCNSCSVHNNHNNSNNVNGNGNAKKIVNGQRRPSDIPVFSRKTSENVGLGGNNRDQRHNNFFATTDGAVDFRFSYC